MFSLNRGEAAQNNEMKDQLPIVPMPEDSETLQQLLLLIYPYVDEPVISDAALLLKLGKMAQKYCVDIVEAKLQKQLLGSPLVAQEPFRIYVIAVQLKWEQVASLAAFKTVDTPLRNLPHVSELQDISGKELYRFLKYRFDNKLTEPYTSFTASGGDTTLPQGGSPTIDMSVVNSTDVGPGIAEAEEPFNSSASADIVIRSCDSVEFFIMKSQLCFVSPVFNSLLLVEGNKANETGAPTHVSGLPVLSVPEDSKTLRHVFMMMYHLYVESQPQITPELLINAGMAMRKYKIMRLDTLLQKQMSDSGLMKEAPYRAYAIAIALGWNSVAKAAAINTLHKPPKKMPDVNEMGMITGSQLFQL
ncbi:hypothetical protein AMATHDRAFT_61409 [Amanita thiersii Skay4041]|uniref:BTB domain-containing protein n=1 Tax=Amanita thiersii Skay4041 TaxID=703135 RepID=A0A2A9NLL6_9AGAR|nr:hypothetical protein AMATHDRAFT_61409 [Amanita thiersii Skay4041]